MAKSKQLFQCFCSSENPCWDYDDDATALLHDDKKHQLTYEEAQSYKRHYQVMHEEEGDFADVLIERYKSHFDKEHPEDDERGVLRIFELASGLLALEVMRSGQIIERHCIEKEDLYLVLACPEQEVEAIVFFKHVSSFTL